MRVQLIRIIILLLLPALATFSSLRAANDSWSAFTQAAAPDLKSTDLIAEGEQVFAKSCSIPYCHGKDGAAGRAPAVRDKRWEVSALRKIILEGIPNTAMPNWNDKLSERQVWAVVAFVLSIAGQATADAPPPPQTGSSEKWARSSEASRGGSLPASIVGDPARGERLFFESTRDRGCAGCHTIDGKGSAVGPDLSGPARKSAREIFRAIVFPAPPGDSRQQLLRLTMNDGEKILALKQEETASSIRVYDVGTAPPVLRRLAKDRIQTAEPLKQSAMPSRYAETYTLRELLDLVAFLKSSGAPSPQKVTLLDVQ